MGSTSNLKIFKEIKKTCFNETNIASNEEDISEITSVSRLEELLVSNLKKKKGSWIHTLKEPKPRELTRSSILIETKNLFFTKKVMYSERQKNHFEKRNSNNSRYKISQDMLKPSIGYYHVNPYQYRSGVQNYLFSGRSQGDTQYGDDLFKQSSRQEYKPMEFKQEDPYKMPLQSTYTNMYNSKAYPEYSDYNPYLYSDFNSEKFIGFNYNQNYNSMGYDYKSPMGAIKPKQEDSDNYLEMSQYVAGNLRFGDLQ